MAAQVEDPFAAPAPIQSNFASVQSFRGRLVIIEPTGSQMVPNQDTGVLQERVTADITTVDGKGAVEIFSYGDPTGRTLDGPLHKGVWIGQEILINQLKDKNGHFLKMVLTRLETKNPGQKAKKGNPWGMDLNITDADKQLARDFLAGRKIEQASSDAPF